MKSQNGIIKSNINKIIALSFIVILFVFAITTGIKVGNDLLESDSSGITIDSIDDLYNEDEPLPSDGVIIKLYFILITYIY